MATIKEWRCLAHGAFDSADGVCEWGCTTVVREFRTAPGHKSAKTKTSDRALERMAKRYGLTDMSASKTGSVAGDRMAKQKGFGNIGGHDFTPRWGGIPKGNTYDVGKGAVVERHGAQGGAEAFVKSSSNGQAEAIDSALPIAAPPRRMRPNIVGRDSVTANEFSDAVSRAQ